MIVMGLRFMGDVPFRDVFIHALVRDAEGQKMSKSKGNVIDPLIVIEKYGADAFRFTLAALAAQGRDIRLSEERIEGYRHFCNKLWNAARFVLMSTEGIDPSLIPQSDLKMDLADRWIVTRANELIASVNESLEDYRFNEAAQCLYQFLWHEFCDWYLEIVKARIQAGTDAGGILTGKYLLLRILEVFLRLLHPFMPFVTEEIWQIVPHQGTTIMLAPWPKGEIGAGDLEAKETMERLMEIIRAVRNIRSEMNISQSKEIELYLKTEDESQLSLFRMGIDYLQSLGRASRIEISPHLEKPEASATAVVKGVEVFVPLKGLIKVEEERARLDQELRKLDKELERASRKLASTDFLNRAPEEVVSKERAIHQQLIDSKSKLQRHVEMLRFLE